MNVKAQKEDQESTCQETEDKKPMTKEEIKQRLSMRAFEYLMWIDEEE